MCVYMFKLNLALEDFLLSSFLKNVPLLFSIVVFGTIHALCSAKGDVHLHCKQGFLS